eukprot:12083863-Alexandrium_andersonii.AAC.1
MRPPRSGSSRSTPGRTSRCSAAGCAGLAWSCWRMCCAWRWSPSSAACAARSSARRGGALAPGAR